LASYSLLGILHKIAEQKNCRARSISILMCAWSLLFVTIGHYAVHASFRVPATIALLALPFGICAGIAILALQSALMLGNISTSWLAVNLSAGIPTVLSILLYHEAINKWKVIALLAMAVSMLLLWKDSRSTETLPVRLSDD
jgi:uncharacterized membrane protein